MDKKCIFCSETIDSSRYSLIDDHLKEILEVLFIKLDCAKSKNPVICFSCKENLYNFFNFKSVCLESEDQLIPYLSSSNSGVKDLRKIVNDQNRMTILGNLQVCRLCKNFVGGTVFKSLKELLKETSMMRVFQRHISELDLSGINNPIVCGPCQDILSSFCNFVKFVPDSTEYSEEKTDSCQLEDKVKKDCGSPNADEIHIPQIKEDKVQIPQITVDQHILEIKNEHEEPEAKEMSRHVKLRSSEVDDVKNNQNATAKHLKKDTFKCAVCSFRTSTLRAFSRHLTCFHKNSMIALRCSQCSSQLASKKSLLMHVVTHLEGTRPLLESNQRKIKRKLQVTQRHTNQFRSEKKYCVSNNGVKSCAPKKMQCHMCGYQTLIESSLKRHMIVHQRSAEKIIFKCPYCSYSSAYVANLRRHLTEVEVNMNHQSKVVLKCASAVCPFETISGQRLGRHLLGVHENSHEVLRCFQCLFRSVNKKELVMHILTHFEVKCDSSPPSSANDVKKPIQSIDSGPVDQLHTQGKYLKKCSIGSKVQSNLKKHMTVHQSSEKKIIFKCPGCSYRSVVADNLEKHVTKTNHQRKMFKCAGAVCSFQSESELDFDHHLQNVHGNSQETLRCYQCSFHSIRNDKLIMHIRKHFVKKLSRSLPTSTDDGKGHLQNITKRKYFPSNLNHPKPPRKVEKCPICSKLQSNMRRHMIVHQRPEDRIMFECPACFYRSAHTDNLRKHVMKHDHRRDIFKCASAVCSFQSESEQGFGQHLESVHKNSRETLKCYQCLFHSDSKNKLISHIVSRHFNVRDGE